MRSGRPFLAPLQPSNLRSLTGALPPVSPVSPLRIRLYSPPLPSPGSIPLSPAFTTLDSFAAAPAKPMPWIWSCHKCHTPWFLGVTRRCLHDGHYFCGGITVDPFTGKTKNHRACASEFDYVGWENHGKWRTQVTEDRSLDGLDKHCERKCDFPRACHWTIKHTPRKTADFSFLDPKSLGTETTGSPSTLEKDDRPTLKKTGHYIDKIVKAAEKCTSQLTTLLSPIEEEGNFSSMPGYVPPPTSAPSTPPQLPELLSLTGLGLSFPSLDFSRFTRHLGSDTTASSSSERNSTTSTPSQDQPPELSTGISSSDDSDLQMTDWLSDDPISPVSRPTTDTSSFNFTSDPSHGPEASLADEDYEDDSPISPRKNAWNWTAGDIGVALGLAHEAYL